MARTHCRLIPMLEFRKAIDMEKVFVDNARMNYVSNSKVRGRTNSS
jgi:hypothetical protein